MQKAQNELRFRLFGLAIEARGLEAIRSVRAPLAFLLFAAALLVLCVASSYAAYVHLNVQSTPTRVL